MNTFMAAAIGYFAIVLILAVFIVFLIRTKRLEIVAVTCGDAGCDLNCESCHLLPNYLKRQAD